EPTRPIQTQGERVWKFLWDYDQLFPAQPAVPPAGHENEPLLILRNCIVLNERRIANDYQARRVHLNSLICATTFFNGCAYCYLRILVPFRVSLKFCLIVCVIIGLGKIAFFRLDQWFDPDVGSAAAVGLERERGSTA